MKIDGAAITVEIFENLRKKIDRLREKGITPHLAIILVGDNPASLSYVGRKEKKAAEIGAKTTVIRLESGIRNEKLRTIIEKLNADPAIHGIIVQRPLPPQIDGDLIDRETDPTKDIDGFHPESPFPMPLAEAVIKVLQHVKTEVEPNKNFSDWLKSKNIVIIGKGKTGGGPTMKLLTKMQTPFTIIDSKTTNPEEILREADIVVAAVGKPGVLNVRDLKKGVILIGVGMAKTESGKLEPDYNQREAAEHASYYTPVPGGVGPVNVASLLENLVTAAERNQMSLRV